MDNWRLRSLCLTQTHKEGRGNQGSQFNEVLQLLQQFQQRSNGWIDVVLAIVDGPHFAAKNVDQFALMKEQDHHPSNALTIQDFPSFLSNFPNHEAPQNLRASPSNQEGICPTWPSSEGDQAYSCNRKKDREGNFERSPREHQKSLDSQRKCVLRIGFGW